MDELISALGARIKAIRKMQGMTLGDLSASSGVSVSALSKVENGRINASVDTIFKIARGLGVLFDNLLASPSRETEGTARLVVTRRGDAQRFPTEIYDYYVHSPELVRKSMLPLVMRVKARQAPNFLDWSTHRGEEFVLVLRGAIELHTHHYAPARLEAGDSAYFDSLMRHAFISVGEGEAEILSVSLAQGEMPSEAWHPDRTCSDTGLVQTPGEALSAGRRQSRGEKRNQGDTA